MRSNIKWVPTLRNLVVVATVALGAAACGGGSSDSTPAAGSPPPAGTPPAAAPPPASSGPDVTPTDLAACPSSTTLITTLEWPDCLQGKRIVGVEPFNNQRCELRFGANGVIEYFRNDVLALAIPARSQWRPSSFGLYQNDPSGGRRIFLASITPDLAPVAGQIRPLSVDLSIASLVDDTIEVKYFDTALSRQAWNCSINVL